MRTSGSTFQKLVLMFFPAAIWLFVFAVNHSDVAQQSEEPLFPIWDARGKEGFIDADGKTVIAPLFDKVTSFSEGVAAVRVGNKWGYIDRSGNVIVTPRWNEVYAYSDGVAAVVDGVHGYGYTPLPEEGDPFDISLKACGYIDKTGQYIIKPSIERKWTQCPAFEKGLAVVCFDPTLKTFFPEFADAGLCGYINKSGDWIIKPQFDGAMPFSEDLALVRLRRYHDKISNQWLSDFAFIDKTGKTIFELKGNLEAHSFREGLAQVARRAGKFSFIDSTGQTRFELNAINVGDFSNGRALAQDQTTKLYGYIDRGGKWIISPKYPEATSFSDGFASVCNKPRECSYINLDGKVVAEHGGKSFRRRLVLQHLRTRTISEKPDFRNIYGYKNKEGKYVWVSPGGDYFLDQKWWSENYIGPDMPTSFRRP